MDAIKSIMQEIPHTTTRDSLEGQFVETRLRTLGWVAKLEYDDFVVQTASYMSPPKWHLGHVSWLYQIIMKRLDPSYQFYREEFSTYLNSYYNQFGEPHRKDRRGVVSRPTLDRILDYYVEVSRRVGEFLQNNRDSRTQSLFQMGLNHECQHQELLVYDLQHLLADQYIPLKYSETPRPPGPVRTDMISIDGGIYEAGYAGDGFCYDVELPRHRVYLNDYVMGRFPVTNGEYIKFMEDGGYESYKYWLSDGWKTAQEEEWESPMYWEYIDNKWHTRDFAGIRPVNMAEPVVHVSYYEADAYAKWAGMRLPTEFEWEKAACWDGNIPREFPWGDRSPSPQHCNLLESHTWKVAPIGSYPQGASPCGCQQMIGDVWEWTSSEFVGYPGFQSAFEEYNDKWFTSQKVLRGGSFGTPSMSIRASYRNFFRMDERWMLAGFRLAGYS